MASQIARNGTSYAKRRRPIKHLSTIAAQIPPSNRRFCVATRVPMWKINCHYAKMVRVVCVPFWIDWRKYYMKYTKLGYCALLCTALAMVSGCSDDSKTDLKNPSVCDAKLTPCLIGYSCVDSVCLKNATFGQACGDGIVCVEGKCTNGFCINENISNGNSNPNAGIIGSQCQNDKQCQEGTCLARVCTITAAAGESCSDTLPCATKLVCDAKTSKCLKTAGLGSACSESVICSIGECVDGTCAVVTEEDRLKTTDTDGDTIPDFWDRCDNDKDEDGTPDCQDLDSDGDTIPDSVEAGTDRELYEDPIDSDSDTIPDFLSLDADGNGIPDAVEGLCKVNRDENGDPLRDDDGNIVVADSCKPFTLNGVVVKSADGIPLSDTNGDTIPDFQSYDNDGDGLHDVQEIAGFTLVRDGQIIPGRLCGTAPCEPGTPDNPWDSDGDTIPDYNSPDSDGDTIPDSTELKIDTDGDGNLDIYDLDSDGDTIPDAEEKDLFYTTPEGVKTLCVISPDCDGDGLPDGDEVNCDPQKYPFAATNTRLSHDSDGDGGSDAAEYAAAQFAIEQNKNCEETKKCYKIPSLTQIGQFELISSPDQVICDAAVEVKDIFDFYFELPKNGPEKSDNLIFSPSVSKLDVVINLDVTGSMQAEIDDIKSKLGSTIIPKTKERVSDSAFGISAFADFPITLGNNSGIHYGYPTNRTKYQADKPWNMLANVTTDSGVLTGAVSNYALTDGADYPEAGYESLWQIAGADTVTSETQTKYATMANDGTYCTGSPTGWTLLEAITPTADRWGGARFRNDSLPVVVHVTDAPSHSSTLATGFSLQEYPYATYIQNPHTDVDVHQLYKDKGARIISVYRRSSDDAKDDKDEEHIAAGAQHPVLLNTSTETNAIVPACAFKKSDNTWTCGENKCCTVTTAAGSVDPNDGKCTLSYGIVNGASLSETLVDGIDALVKYGTNEVATRVIGSPIPGSDKTTACFIKRVVANKYVAPPQEPEASCNPVATKEKFKANPTDPDLDYFNGFSNFAAGTSSINREGAKLHFDVIAQNDDCVAPKRTAQAFSAQIELYNPTTNLSLGKREVYIIVPGEIHVDVVN